MSDLDSGRLIMESMPPVGNPHFLTRRQWLQQILPGTTSDFRPSPSRRGEVQSSFDAIAWDISEDVDNFIGESVTLLKNGFQFK